MPKKGGKEAGKPHPSTAASTTRRVRPSASARSVVAAVARKVADFFLLFFFNLFSTPPTPRPHPTPNFPKQQIVSLFLVLALVLATAVSASPANVYPARLRRSLFADEV